MRRKSHTNGSILGALRKEKGFTQRAFAEKLGIQRTRLVRIEKRTWQELTLGDLELIANGLGMKWTEIAKKFNGANTKGIAQRSSIEQPSLLFHYSDGIQLASLLNEPAPCFVGVFTLAPHKNLCHEESPQSEFLFYCVLAGTLVLSLSGTEQVFKAGECFRLFGDPHYELYNPHQFQKVQVLVFSNPSFIQKKLD